MTTTTGPKTVEQIALDFDNMPTLSMYLPIRLGLNMPQGYRAEALVLLAKVEDGVQDASKSAYDSAAGRVLDYVRNEYQPSGRTLVVFASADAWLHQELPIELPAMARFQSGAFVSPLVAAIEDNPTAVIACVSQREYRAIVASLGTLRAAEHASSDVPGRQRQGGWAASRYELDREQHVEDHIKRATQRTATVCQEYGAKWLVLGGSSELTRMLEEALPAEIRSLVAGTFAVEMFASDEELMAAGLAVAAKAEASEESNLAEEIVTKTLSRANACLGWEETRSRLADGRVQVLAMPRSALGSDEAELALSMAWDTGASIEFIGVEAEAALQPYGGTGALLRY